MGRCRPHRRASQILSARAANTRERRHDKIIAAAVIGSMLICFALAFYPELGKAFASVPVASSYFTDAFSARPLPCTIRLIQYTRLSTAPQT